MLFTLNLNFNIRDYVQHSGSLIFSFTASCPYTYLHISNRNCVDQVTHTEVAGKLLGSPHLGTTNQDHPNDVDLRYSPGVHGEKKTVHCGFSVHQLVLRIHFAASRVVTIVRFGREKVGGKKLKYIKQN